MTLAEIFSEELNIIWEDGEEWMYDKTIGEAKDASPLDYKRHWYEFPKNERHYSKKTGNRLYGCWVYDHREKAGATYGDGKVVHHKDHDKHNNSKNNLSKITQSEHCKIDPNAKKHDGCKVKGCKKPHYSHGYCQAHYMRLVYRKGSSYDKSKNYSKDER